MKVKQSFLAAIALMSMAALTSCGGGNKSGNLAEGASGDMEEYVNSDVNAIEQARPTIMVIPSDQVLQNFKSLKTERANGREYILRDYKKYLLKDIHLSIPVGQDLLQGGLYFVQGLEPGKIIFQVSNPAPDGSYPFGLHL